jgi:RNA polymerase sigma factor (sigma-70 family)
VTDLELAQACAAGDEAAWERFVREFRPGLYRAADAMDPTGRARDLADALFGDLFGVREKEGVRQSLFRYFEGRSSLATWLRAVLAQRYIDHIRSHRRLTPLPDDEGVLVGAREEARLSVESADDSRCRTAVRAALSMAIGELSPRDRLRLTCYYVQDLTLAQIGALFHEHEASASRHLTRVRRELRVMVEAAMRDTHGYGAEGCADCLRTVMNDAGDLDLSVMLARARKEAEQDRSI